MQHDNIKINNHFEGLADPFVSKDACGVGFVASTHNIKSRDIVLKSFQALKNLAHRGAVDADGKTGDGAGIMTSIPEEYYRKQAKKNGVDLGEGHFGIMMIFYPNDPDEKAACRDVVESVLGKSDIPVMWSRDVPANESILGQKAASVKPNIRQKFLACPRYMVRDEFEQLLFFVRKEIEVHVLERSLKDFYITSMSTKTIVHKGLFVGDEVKDFYLDLQDDEFISEFAVFHQRFSTNTFPSWPLAQPFRMMAHNGEINTIQGNRNWMRAREFAEQGRSWVPEDHALGNFIMPGRSDSATFDNALETYVFGGRGIYHSIVHMMPEAWQNKVQIDDDLKAFYEYHACMAEHWGGPAAISFSDGKYVGAIVDRNGLRPARYKITKDHLFVCSEMGCVDFPDDQVVENGKLSPGTVILINLKRNKISKNEDVKFSLADQQPYAQWVEQQLVKVDEVVRAKGNSIYQQERDLDDETLLRYQKIFGYTKEDFDLILNPMFETGKEPLGSMGDDTPLSVFSKKPRLLYTYFKQLFAQVTNPPIDPIRERFGTSLRMYLGKSGNIFEETKQHAKQIRVRSPILSKIIFDSVVQHAGFKSATLSAQFPIADGPEALEDTVMDLCVAAEKAVDDGNEFIVLSDRYLDKDHAPIPMLLAVSSVHHHLIRQGKRLNISMLVETAEARETHHFACLIGYGASAIYPYLVLNQALCFAKESETGLSGEEVVRNFIKAVEKGLLKIMSKMGISVLQSYHAAQIFEALGVKQAVVKHHFEGTPCKISGADLSDIAADYLSWHQAAYAKKPDEALDVGGNYRFRGEGEYHAFNPDVVRSLHKAVINNDLEEYLKYAEWVNGRDPMSIRDLLQIKKGKAKSLDEVEDSKEIVKRFCTPGISYGAISKEVHEDLAIAMNRIQAKSDSGEGGEDPARYQKLENGDSKNSAIKQVASGRFGVTAYYLSQAQELEIKVAQGAKPGEGGQLPGHKVSVDIAAVRHSTPGVTLISPPPHHDIYSIEDLAQLIYDLKQINPTARICVKLVAEDGVGTIAAGVAKAHADVILISGYDGGTGASPLSSIKHAGLPWELGLAETQQVLVKNGLRERVTLRTDGGLKTGLDVVKAALLGAEEFGFGTASMVAVGCVMVRKCHLNTCPVGVATQDPKLRAKYKGTPERLINMFHFISEEVRRILAEMGFESLDQIVGRVDLLEHVKEIESAKSRKINLKRILYHPAPDGKSPLKNEWARNDWADDKSFDDAAIPQCKNVLDSGEGKISLDLPVKNIHRSLGAKLSYEIVSRYGPDGLPKGSIQLNLKGTVGQSLGVFAMKTLELHLEGEANDYVGKGLSGAIISIQPPAISRFCPEDNIICGNTCLYGATSGKLFVNGRAGERFAVRNSGALAVVEGVDDNGCEYMTGGKVLILGSVGNNFGAGMTGGIAYIYDKIQTLRKNYNPGDIELEEVNWKTPESKMFFGLLEEHVKLTSSPLAKRMIENWDRIKSRFVRVVPKEL
jgi:glutamate synthase domain-containing protein 2/glutamate synthase domain-containing protein 1/glutamate synthase domain-containing protein 3